MQIRSFLQWQKKKCIPKGSRKAKVQTQNDSTENDSLPNQIQNRQRIPTTIYKCFTSFIENGEIPSIIECTKAYEKSPSLLKYKPQQIQDLVCKAIEFDTSSDLTEVC